MEARRQILFLVDVATERDDSIWIKSIYLACCRILLSYAKRDEVTSGCSPLKIDTVKWSYELLNIIGGGVSLTRKPTFKELHTDVLGGFYDDLISHTHSKLLNSTIKTLYNTLAAVVQDYHWDMPTLMSPLPQKRRKRGKTQLSHESHVTNHIYIFSELLSQSSGHCLNNQLFPSPLISQLLEKCIAVHLVWIPVQDINSIDNIQSLISSLNDIGGTVIPLTALVTPPILKQSIPSSSPLITENLLEIDEGAPLKLDSSQLLLPPVTYTSYYKPVITRPPCYHILCNIDGSLLCIVELTSIYCTSPLLNPDVGVVTLHPGSLVNNGSVPLEHLSLIESSCCVGLQVNDDIRLLLTTPTDNETMEKKEEFETPPTSQKQRHSCRLSAKPSPNYIHMANPWKRTKGNHGNTNSEEGGTNSITSKDTNCSFSSSTHSFNSVSFSDIAVDQTDVRSHLGNRILSNQFENLCLWLSRNDIALIVSFKISCDEVRLALLQSTTPLLATLTMISPSYQDCYLSCHMTIPSLSLGHQSHNEICTYINDSELFLSLSTLFKEKRGQCLSSPDEVWTSLLHPSTTFQPVESFSWHYVSSWTCLLSKYGVSSTMMEPLKELSCNDRNENTLISELKALYTPSHYIGGLSGYHDNKESSLDVKATQLKTLDEVIDTFQLKYSQKLSEPSANSVQLLSWVRESINEFVSLALNSVSDAPVTMETIWTVLQNHILQKELKDDRVEVTILQYQLQIMLVLESVSYCTPLTDYATLSNMLVQFLRRLSLIASPAFVGKLLKDVILPQYSDCCQSLLKEVFDGLMLPLPPCLSPGTDSHTPTPGNESDDEDEYDKLLYHSLQSMKESEQTSRILTRHASFQGSHLNRQIAVTRKVNKTAIITDSSETQLSRKVRRSLFSRSLSVPALDENIKKRKRENKDDNLISKRHKGPTNDLVVKETPIKKQVDNYRMYKLQRTRSKSTMDNTSNNITIIEESPQRSFYSKMMKGQRSQEIKFETPPPKTISPSLVLNKHPSPAVLQSLLYGDWVSPSSQTPQSQPHPSQESPELFITENTRTYTSARALVYNSESPLKTPSKPPPKSPRDGLAPPTTPLHSILKTPDKTPHSLGKKSVSFVTMATEDDDRVDSASMMAFNLSTPTKDELTSFEGYFLNQTRET